MIGLYDSGLGGLTVLRALRGAGVDQDVVYFADQAHVPYGDRTDAQILGYLSENLALLAELDVAAVVTACNTSCAIAQRAGWPATAFPVLDIVATAGASFAGSPLRKIGVVATAATVRSGAYGRAIRAAAPHAEVVELAAPPLVPLVERGAADSDAARDAVAAVVAALPDDLDALVYGCTHYPLLDAWFAGALGPNVARIDPAHAQAAATNALVARLGLPAGNGTTTYYTNGDPVAFEASVRRWTGDLTGRVAGLVAR
ncbi:MAG TPA: glutamate racemase [Candidatus Sulfotelmatobacter sp.]|nr:glutamate racemase [Candidatus Sulfotelmatobacter sp.]